MCCKKCGTSGGEIRAKVGWSFEERVREARWVWVIVDKEVCVMLRDKRTGGAQ